MKNQVQLITYVDRLGGAGIPALHEWLRGPLAGLFGGVHLLPFYDPIDGADAGFDPIDHLRVDPRLGDWRDIEALAADVDVMADVIVNHVSSASPQFRSWQREGSASPHADLFLTFDKVFPSGAKQDELLRIYRPRPGLPFTPAQQATGERHLLWTTFTAQQVDIDVESEAGRRYLGAIIEQLARSRVRMVRLDAVGYAIKRAGQSCFMMPETFAFIDAFAREARAKGIEVLVEVHSYYRRQMEIAALVDWVYDFALPPLVLHALMRGRGDALAQWLAIRPHNAITVLDTHDGIGIIDIGPDASDRQRSPGLIEPAELDALVEWVHANSQGESRRATGAAANNLDLYQVNCTYFDALGRDESAYLAARAIQFFVPGVPQVYYVGLLGGVNDMELLARTGVGRDINRHHFSPEEVRASLRRPMVQRLLDLIRLRNTHPAFSGQFTASLPRASELQLRWDRGAHWIELTVDLAARQWTIRSSDAAPAATPPALSESVLSAP